MMRQIDLDGSTEVAELVKTKLEKIPGHVAKAQRFSYRCPELETGKSRAIVRLVTTDILLGLVQVFKTGGEVKMHSHTGMDGFWMVLGGLARFYFEDGEVAEVARHEGVCTPRNVKYWFEAVGDELLEILQVDAIHPGLVNKVESEANDAQTRERLRSVSLYDAQPDG